MQREGSIGTSLQSPRRLFMAAAIADERSSHGRAYLRRIKVTLATGSNRLPS